MSRIQSLDILRFIAVLMVVGSHTYPMYHWTYGPLAFASDFIHACGGLGVDLFFVLSGFLVSGLLFKESKIRIWRFWVRRGFKIYPSFYALILATPFLIHPGTNYYAEVFWYQNYVGGLWYHTWSLAVEEHFYFLLPLLLTIIKPKWFPAIFVVVALAILISRILFADFQGWQFQTHFRIDSLLFGVLLSYYHHFGSLALIKNRLSVLIAILCLIVPFVITIPAIAPTLSYIGFGVIMVNFLEVEGNRFIAYIGEHSYSIYLWHEPVKYTVASFFPKGEETLLLNLTYIVLSFAIGILMAKLIEFPFLKLRDKFTAPKTRSVLIKTEAPA